MPLPVWEYVVACLLSDYLRFVSVTIRAMALLLMCKLVSVSCEYLIQIDCLFASALNFGV